MGKFLGGCGTGTTIGGHFQTVTVCHGFASLVAIPNLSSEMAPLKHSLGESASGRLCLFFRPHAGAAPFQVKLHQNQLRRRGRFGQDHDLSVGGAAAGKKDVMFRDVAIDGKNQPGLGRGEIAGVFENQEVRPALSHPQDLASGQVKLHVHKSRIGGGGTG